MNPYSSAANSILKAIDSKIQNVETVLPAKVKKNNDGKVELEIIGQKLIDDEYIDYPTVLDVSVCHLNGNSNKSYLKFPVKVGDYGLLLCFSIDIDNFILNARKEMSSDRQHDINDSVFIPFINPDTISDEDNGNNTVLKNDKMKLTLDPDGKISVEGATGEIVDLLVKLSDNNINIWNALDLVSQDLIFLAAYGATKGPLVKAFCEANKPLAESINTNLSGMKI